MSPPESFRVLLVDDDTDLLDSLEPVLSESFVVRRCNTGQVASRLLQKEPKLLPCFVLTTGHSGKLLDRVSYGDRKVLGMLSKPFKPERLIERVNQFARVAKRKHSNAALEAVVLGDRK